MKRFCTLVTVVLLLAGCASGTGGGSDASDASKVKIRIQQLDNENGYDFVRARSVNIRYALYATNTTASPVTLSRVEFRTIGTGAYSLAPTSASLNIPIGPTETIRTVISAWGNSQGGNAGSKEPVTLHGTAYLTGLTGPFVQIFTENLQQR